MTHSLSNETFQQLYPELRQLAGALMTGEKHSTLQPTLLVHEAYLRLARRPAYASLDRQSFLALAAHVMRHVIVDYARRRSVERRGGNGLQLVPGELAAGGDGARLLEEFVAIHHLLDQLGAWDPELAQLVELRVFGGLTLHESARALGVKYDHVRRSWTVARAWLLSRLGGGGGEEG